MEATQRITDVWTDVNNITNWSAPYFDWPKAYVASVFAKIAYLHIPAYELKNADRANLIPCIEYREILRGATNLGIRQILGASDFADFFVVERPYVIAVVVKVRDVVFISLRGTQNLYDWLVNLNARQSRAFANTEWDIYFHKGFHRAAASCMYEIHSEIVRRYGEECTVYVAGHSLGGALAAILHAVWGSGRMQYRRAGSNSSSTFLATHSCYTFGMPRYGNFHAIEHFANPFHIYNQADIVPTVPPRLLGYADSLSEYCLTANAQHEGSNLKGNSFSEFIYCLASKKGIKEHDMEIYMGRIKRVST